MKTIRNKSRAPLRIPLPGGKVLHLGPNKTGQIADNAVERPGVQRLLEAKEIEIVGDGAPDVGGGSGEQAPGAESTRARRGSSVSRRSGDR